MFFYIKVLEYLIKTSKSLTDMWDMFQESTNNLDIIYDDINNFTDVKTYDYIINFAAESHVDNSIKDGTPFVTSNYTGVYNLLTQLKDNQRFIQVGTDEVYGSLDFKCIRL